MTNTKRRLSTTKEGPTKWSINANYVENMATLHFHAACIIDDIKRCATLVEIMVITPTLVLGPVDITIQVTVRNISTKKFTNKRDEIIITLILKISVGKITLMFHLKYWINWKSSSNWWRNSRKKEKTVLINFPKAISKACKGS